MDAREFRNEFRRQAKTFVENYAESPIDKFKFDQAYNPKSFKRARLIDFSNIDLDQASVEDENNSFIHNSKGKKNLKDESRTSEPKDDHSESSNKSFRITLKKSLPVFEKEEENIPENNDIPVYKRKIIRKRSFDSNQSGLSSDRQSVKDFFQRAKDKIQKEIERRDGNKNARRGSLQSNVDSSVNIIFFF